MNLGGAGSVGPLATRTKHEDSNGPPPKFVAATSVDDETKRVAEWLRATTSAGLQPNEFGVFVRSDAQIDRAKVAVEAADLPWHVLDEHVDTNSDEVSIATMHLAKGLEFKAVVVMACDDDVLPLQSRIAGVGDSGDLQDVYETERQLLYVACTRARDCLLVSGVSPISEFIEDLRAVRRAEKKPRK